MNCTTITICCIFLVLCILGFIGGIGIGMSIKSENERLESLKKFAEWLKQNKEENK